MKPDFNDIYHYAGGKLVTQDFTDLIPVEDIIEPMLLQADPARVRRFFYNHFVR
jgi:hypothetical protein